jgi:hypothetical protein
MAPKARSDNMTRNIFTGNKAQNKKGARCKLQQKRTHFSSLPLSQAGCIPSETTAFTTSVRVYQ